MTDLPTAELVKVSTNAFLATKISFINAIAEICEARGPRHVWILWKRTPLPRTPRTFSHTLTVGVSRPQSPIFLRSPHCNDPVGAEFHRLC
jgi:hypothetical protein